MSTAVANAAKLGPPNTDIQCPQCEIRFAIPKPLYEVRLVDGELFYCPLGHSQYFPPGKSQIELEREAKIKAERQLASREEDLRSERASHAATKGHLTRAKERAEAGVCPHCHRSFAQVKRHVERMHPIPEKSKAKLP